MRHLVRHIARHSASHSASRHALPRPSWSRWRHALCSPTHTHARTLPSDRTLLRSTTHAHTHARTATHLTQAVEGNEIVKAALEGLEPPVPVTGETITTASGLKYIDQIIATSGITLPLTLTLTLTLTRVHGM